MTIKLHGKCPDFTAKTTGNKTVSLSSLKGRPFVLYFYPKDDTPGCTQESKDFCFNYNQFTNKGIKILGVSRDSLKSHEKFKEKYALPFELISDEDETLCQLFGVLKTKNVAGKETQGVERSTFLFNGKAELVHEWRGVKVDGHIKEVYDAATQLCSDHHTCC